MKLDDFVKKGSVKKIDADKSLARSLVKTTSEDLKFLNKLEINE